MTWFPARQGGPVPRASLAYGYLVVVDYATQVQGRHGRRIRPSSRARGLYLLDRRSWGLGRPSCPAANAHPVSAYRRWLCPTLTFKGREFKPHRLAGGALSSATFVFVAGAVGSLAAVVTGLWDRGHSGEAGTQARRTINAHALLMVGMTVFVLVDLALRWFRYPALSGSTPTVLGLSLAVALIGALGATYGWTLVFSYGLNVETAGDHPIWHRSEINACPESLPIEPGRYDAALSVGSPGSRPEVLVTTHLHQRKW